LPWGAVEVVIARSIRGLHERRLGGNQKSQTNGEEKLAHGGATASSRLNWSKTGYYPRRNQVSTSSISMVFNLHEVDRDKALFIPDTSHS
jgi:hypothetical protein